VVGGLAVPDGAGASVSLGGCGRIGDADGDPDGDEDNCPLDRPGDGAEDPAGAVSCVGSVAPVVVAAPVSPARGWPVTAVEQPTSTVSAASIAAPRLVARRLRVVIVTAAP
jgi:hypothetical protein